MGLVEPIRGLAGVCLSMCTCVYLSAGSVGKEVRCGCRAPHVMEEWPVEQKGVLVSIRDTTVKYIFESQLSICQLSVSYRLLNFSEPFLIYK